MKYLNEIKKGTIIGVSFLITIIFGGIIYASIGSSWTSLDEIEGTSGGSLSADSWNKMLANINSLNNRVSSIEAASGSKITILNSPVLVKGLGSGIAGMASAVNVDVSTLTTIPAGATSIIFKCNALSYVDRNENYAVNINGVTSCQQNGNLASNKFDNGFGIAKLNGTLLNYQIIKASTQGHGDLYIVGFIKE